MKKVLFIRGNKIVENAMPKHSFFPLSKLTLFSSFLGIILLFGTSGAVLLTHTNLTKTIEQTTPAQSVLGATVATPNTTTKIQFSIPAEFDDNILATKNLTVDGSVSIQGKTFTTGTLQASNVLYGITPGNGIAVSSGQTPTITNTGVLSLQGQTGAVNLTAGNNISISGLTITANVPSAPNTFETITVGGTSFSAGNSTDTLTFAAGSGVTLSTDTTNKKLTINATGGLSGLTANGVLYASDSTTAVSLTPGTSGYILQSNGTNSAPSWVANSGSSPAFSSITSGTNTTATMTVGAGATLTYASSGILNANELLGATWASPSAIGITTPNTGAFTTITGSTMNGLTLSSASDGFSVSGGATARTITVTGSNITLTGGGNTLTLTGNSSLNQNLLTTSVPTFAGLTANGNVTLGQTNSNTITPNGLLAASLIPQSTSINLGSLSNYYGTVYAQNILTNATSGQNGFWQLNNGGLSPANSTNDLFLGGTSTTSASTKFAFLNIVGSGTPTASIAGNITLNSIGSLQTTNNQLLTLGGNTTGNISLLPMNGSGSVILGADGGTPIVPTLRGAAATGGNIPGTNLIIAASDGTGTAGSGDLIFQTASGTNSTPITLDNHTEGETFGSTETINGYTVGSQTNMLMVVDVNMQGGTVSSVTWKGSATGWTKGGSEYPSDGSGDEIWYLKSPSSGSGTVVVTTTGNQHLFVGVATFYNVNQTTPVSTAATTTGTTSPDSLAVSTSNGQVVVDEVGNASFCLANQGSGQTRIFADSLGPNTIFGGSYKSATGLTTTMSWTFSSSCSWGAVALPLNPLSNATQDTLVDRLHIAASGNVGIGESNPTAFALQVAGNVGPDATDTYNLGSPSLEWNNLYVKNIIDSALSGTDGFWQLNSGALSPANITNDFLLGGTATSSAIFGFLNNAGGTPTATISSNFSLKVPTGSTPAETLNILNGGALNVQTSLGGDTGLSSRLYVTNNGNIGIGTTAPSALLSVAGNAEFGSGDQATPTATTIRGAAANGSSIAGANFTFDASNGTGTGGSGDIIFRTAPASGLITIDATSSANQDSFSSTLTWNHTTTTNSNRLLVVGVNEGNSNNVSTITYGGNSLTQVNSILCASSNCKDEMWYLVNPPTGTNSIVVTYNSSTNHRIAGATTFYNVSQTSPLGTSVTASGTSTTPSVTVTGTTTQQFVIDSLATNNTFPWAPGSNQTQLWNQTNGALGTITGSYKTGSVSNTTMSWSGTSGSWGEIGVSINPVTATSADTLVDRLHITGTGNVGVGIASPTDTLTVNGAGRFYGTYTENTDNNGIYAGYLNGTPRIMLDTGNHTQSWEMDNNAGNFRWYNPNDTAMTLNATNKSLVLGNQFNSDYNTIQNNTNTIIDSYYATSNPTGTNPAFSFQTGSTPTNLLTILNNGAVGIGSTATSPLGTLDVRSTIGINPIATFSGKTSFAGLVVDNAGSGDLFTASSSGLSRFVITQNGNVGIGTTTPTAALMIASTSFSDNFNRANAASLGSNWTKVTDAGTDFQIVSNQLNETSSDNSTSALGAYTSQGITGADYSVQSDIIFPSSSDDWIAIGGRESTNGGSDMNGYFAFASMGQQKVAIYKRSGGTWTQLSTAPSVTITASTTYTMKLVMQGTALSLYWNGTLKTSITDATFGNGGFAGIAVGNPNLVGTIWDNFSITPSAPTVNVNNNLAINPNGWIGIGTTTPSYAIDVQGGGTINDTGNLYVSGNTGLNTTTPQFRLDVVDTQASTGSARIENVSTGAKPVGLDLQLGYTTTSGNSANHFVDFMDGNGNIRGTIEANNSGVAFQTSGIADFAEYMKKDPAETVQWGAVMCLGTDSLVHPCSATQQQIIGVASEFPSFVGGTNLGNSSVTVGLTGQVDTLVSTQNGIILPGDPITASAIPGVGVKATQAGTIIGRAIEGFDGTEQLVPCPEQSARPCGKILVLVNPSYADPAVQIARNGDLNIPPQILASTFPTPTVPQFAAPQTPTSGELNILATSVTDLQTQIASLSASIGKITDLSTQLTSLQKEVALNQAIAGTSTQSALLANLNNTIISGNLTVMGRTVVSDLGITGTLTTGLLSINGLDTSAGSASATINTIGSPLKLQSLALSGVDFENGKLTIDTNGNITTAGDITANAVHLNKLVVTDTGEAPLTGRSVIPVGQTSVLVKTKAIDANTNIFVTAESKTTETLSVPSQAVGDSFTVTINSPMNTPIYFHWFVVN